MVKALLFDGLGHSKEMDLKSAVLKVTAPSLTLTPAKAGKQKSAASDHQFVRVGSLSDGRVLYGPGDAHLQIWAHAISIPFETDEASASHQADLEMANWLARNALEQAQRLVRTVSRDATRGLVTYHFEGVARQAKP